MEEEALLETPSMRRVLEALLHTLLETLLETPPENTLEIRPKLATLASNVFAPLVTKPCNPCNPGKATLTAVCPLTM